MKDNTYGTLYVYEDIGRIKPCEVCGKPGEVRLDPYDAEINQEETIVALCDNCYYEREEDI